MIRTGIITEPYSLMFAVGAMKVIAILIIPDIRTGMVVVEY